MPHTQTKDRLTARREVIRAWLEDLLETKGWNPTDAARAAEISPSTLLRFYNDKRNRHSLSFDTVRKVADGAELELPQSVYEAFGLTPQRVAEEEEGARRPGLASLQRGPSTLPVRELNTEVDYGISPDSLIKRATQRVSRPKELDGDSTAFGFVMPDDTMAPFYPMNTMMFVTRLRRLAKGEIAMIELDDGTDCVRVIEGVEGGTLVTRAAPGEKLERIPMTHIRDHAILRCAVRP